MDKKFIKNEAIKAEAILTKKIIKLLGKTNFEIEKIDIKLDSEIRKKSNKDGSIVKLKGSMNISFQRSVKEEEMYVLKNENEEDVDNENMFLNEDYIDGD